MSGRDYERCRISARLSPEPTRGRSLLGRIRVDCPMTGQERTGVECTGCEQFVGWGLSTTIGQPWLTCRLPCASCRNRHEATIEVAEVVFCEDCRERACAPEDHDELGIGD